jgi:hypothetical protein
LASVTTIPTYFSTKRLVKGIRTKNDDQKTGVEIVRKALSWPHC